MNPGAPKPVAMRRILRMPTLQQKQRMQRIVEYHLGALHHARQCERRGYIVNGEACPSRGCATMKKVLERFEASVCQAVDTCKERKCVSARQVLVHWKACNNENCWTCIPIIEALIFEFLGGKSPRSIRMRTIPEGYCPIRARA